MWTAISRGLALTLAIALCASGCSDKQKENPTTTVETTAAESDQPAEAAPLGAEEVDVPDETALPPGHPPIGDSQPPTLQSAELPEGHPPIPPDLVKSGGDAFPAAQQQDGKLVAAGLQFDVPEGWARQQPDMRMRLAQYSLPGKGDPAVMAVYCFGPSQGGGTRANVERWLKQFDNPSNVDDKPGGDVIGFEQGDLTCTVVQTQGTYSTGMGPMQRGEKKPGYALYGLIVENGPEGTVFVKVTGPEDTVRQRIEELNTFAKSVRRAEGDAEKEPASDS